MKQRFDFEEIRPVYDEEIPELMPSLLEEPAVRNFLTYIRPDLPFEEFKQMMLAIKSKREFQTKLVAPFLRCLAAKTSDSLSLTGHEIISKESSYTFISNHRDIVLDAAFLNILLDEKGFETAEVAIGDNLLIYPWIRTLVRMNKSFIVKRDLPVRQLLDVSKRLSSYINFALKIKGQSVWIAQREGRSKDSKDNTQESVLKMLVMGGSKDAVESVRGLNITPVAISYEYDPCDYLKAKEFQLKRDCPEYKKDKQDDLLNMQTGMTGYKGRIFFHITGLLNDNLDSIAQLPDKSSQISAVAKAIDKMLHTNMRLYPGNYVAYDWLYETDKYADQYNHAEKKKFEDYIAGQIEKIDIENKDVDFLRGKMLEMYSNPVINYYKATEQA